MKTIIFAITLAISCVGLTACGGGGGGGGGGVTPYSNAPAGGN
jgi:hypothetical protein